MTIKPKTKRRCRLGHLGQEPTEQPRPLYSLVEASELLRVSLMTTRRLIADGKLDVLRLGGRVLVRGESLHLLMTGGTSR
jgi:excisionase family DNA binding protein